jgi:hypothetical protein
MRLVSANTGGLELIVIVRNLFFLITYVKYSFNKNLDKKCMLEAEFSVTANDSPFWKLCQLWCF